MKREYTIILIRCLLVKLNIVSFFILFLLLIIFTYQFEKFTEEKFYNKEVYLDDRDTGVYASGAAGQCCRKDLGEDKEILSPLWSFPPSSTISPLSLPLPSGLAVIAPMQVWPNRAHVNSNDKLQLPNATPYPLPSHPSKKEKEKEITISLLLVSSKPLNKNYSIRNILLTNHRG